MTTPEKIELAVSLIRRKAAWIIERASELEAASATDGEGVLKILTYAIIDIDDVFDGFEAAPDEKWMREYYLVMGDHAALTEDGWMPADDAVEAGYQLLDQVNVRA